MSADAVAQQAAGAPSSVAPGIALGRRRLSGWGRYPVLDCTVLEPGSADALSAAALPPLAIARGNGRSYGNSSLSADGTVLTRHLDRLLAFDPASGRLVCEAGTLVADLVATLVPRGWFPPVTPGTKWVTVGGLIAADAHGKNHHGAGSFCDHVDWLDLSLGEGEVLRCSRTEHSDLFAATCGGMGLTGTILRASFRMIPIASAAIAQTTERVANLGEAFAIFDRSAHRTYSVAWVDCLAGGADLGRSVVFLGEHAAPDQLPPTERDNPFRARARTERRLPLDLPSFALNRLSVRALNALYYSRQRSGEMVVDLDTYFYPLDTVLEWNRVYGKRGFVQYQCVLPLEGSAEGLSEVLRNAARDGNASFLAVLERMGGKSFGHLSFPMEGYTLTLDFPVSPPTLRLLERFDAIVSAYRGQLYLAKDARMPAGILETGYPRLAEFRQVRRRYGLDRRFQSSPVAAAGPVTAPVLILGARSDIGRAIARRYAASGRPIVLAARGAAGLEPDRSDLEIRFGVPVSLAEFDVTDEEPDKFFAALARRPGTVIMVAGGNGVQSVSEADNSAADLAMRTNYTGPARYLLAAARLLGPHGGCIVGISSVAGDRGRKANFVYGSAKAGFTAFLSGLRNRLHGRVHVVTVKPGYVATRATAAMRLPEPLTAQPGEVAEAVFAAEAKLRDVVYVRRVWRPIMGVVRLIPERAFKRMSI